MTLIQLVILSVIIHAVCGNERLRDIPIAGQNILYLDGTWAAKSNAGMTINGNVPGDLINDLLVNGKMGEPYYETNWITNKSLWVDHEWVYTSPSFSYNIGSAVDVLLVLEGVKLNANITLNGVSVGVVEDQFLRYTYSVAKILKASGNVLQVSFPSGNADQQCRFMSCSAGWDWAPQSSDPPILSKGIYKSLYLVSVNPVAITHVTPHVSYTGSYPTTPLSDSNHSPFVVNVSVHFYAPKAVSGTLTVSGNWDNNVAYKTTVNVPSASDYITSVSIPAKAVNLWWPNEMGMQNMYNVTVTFTPSSGGSVSTSRRIGFRVFALVTADDSNPSTLEGQNGSSNFTMRFKVNGADAHSRGANFVPMDEFEGRIDPDAIYYLVKSSADAHFNTIRIWGGGLFLNDIFYDVCDELGIMIYHDMMYNEFPYPVNPWVPKDTPMQDAELRHQIRRLSHHPSIVIWDSCNECEAGGEYDSFVMTTIAQEDASRAVWPACPSNGWSSGVDMLYGKPNGMVLKSKPIGNNGPVIEQHGWYFYGDGWPTCQNMPTINLWGVDVPETLDNSYPPTGPHYRSKFISEFGTVGMSSFESMSPTLAPNHWSLHSPPMYYRNYACDNFVQMYFGKQNLNLTGQAALQSQLYYCNIGQAIFLKGYIEQFRAGNTFGTLVWQLNEIWPTGGWGLIEYGTPSVKGQVIGGRWKPIMHLLQASTYTQIWAACDNNARCVVRNDATAPFTGTITVTAIKLSSGSQSELGSYHLNLGSGAGFSWRFCVQSNCPSYSTMLSSVGCNSNGVDCILYVTVVDSNNKQVTKNVLPFVVPAQMTLRDPQIKWQVAANKEGGADVILESSNVAVYTVLTTLANGRFSDNAFLLFPGNTTISFIPFGSLNMGLLTSSLRVEHVYYYLH